MLSFLTKPYPAHYGQSSSIKLAIAVGIFIPVFLIVFKPFGVDGSGASNFELLGYGLITFLCVLLVHYVGPRLVPKYYAEPSYTIGKELLLAAILITLIGIGNAVYNLFLSGDTSIAGSLQVIVNTFLIGIIPLAFTALLEYNRHLRHNLKSSSEIQLMEYKNYRASKATSMLKNYKLKNEDKFVVIDSQNLLFVESVGNYANVVKFEKEAISKDLYRTTLKALQEENDIPGIVRCHRSFIVNLDQVKEVKGNAQGLKLNLENCSEVVPVSRKYIPVVKSYFANLN